MQAANSRTKPNRPRADAGCAGARRADGDRGRRVPQRIAHAASRGEHACAARDAAEKPVTLAEVQAQITAEAAAMPSRWMDPARRRRCRTTAVAGNDLPTSRSPDDIKKAIETLARRARGCPRAAWHTRAGEHRSGRPSRAGASRRRPWICEIEERPAFDDAERYGADGRALLPKPRSCPSASSARWPPPSANFPKPSRRAAGRPSTRWPRR